MDLNKLKTFTVAAETGSISKTASRLYRTQSAITQQIQGLEKELGFSLFERRSSGIHLTQEGRKLYESASLHLSSLEETIYEIKTGFKTLTGVIKIGVLPEFSASFLPDMIQKFRKIHSAIRFQLFHGNDSLTEQRLLTREIEFGLVVSLSKEELFDTHVVRKKDLVAVASPQYLENSPPLEHFNDLSHHCLLEFGENFESFRAWLLANGIKTIPSVLQRKGPDLIIGDDYTLKQMLIRHAGIGILPTDTIEHELESGQLVRIPSQQANPVKIQIRLVHLKNITRNRSQEAFLEFIKQQN